MRLHGEARHLWEVDRLWGQRSAGQRRVHGVRQHQSNNGGGEWRWVGGRGACTLLNIPIVAAARSSSACAEGGRTGPGVILQGESLNHGGGVGHGLRSVRGGPRGWVKPLIQVRNRLPPPPPPPPAFGRRALRGLQMLGLL